MRIEALRLKETGPFSDAVAIERFAPGLNLLAGRNELGKSTIFRALKLLFCEAYSARKEAVRKLQPHTGGAPFVSCDFEIDGVPWALSKQYLAGKFAELRERDGRRVYRDGDVEPALQDVLANTGLDVGVLDVLWVAQGESFKMPAAGADLHRRIGDLIRAEAESISGGNQLVRVHDLVRAKLAELVTSKNRRAKAGGEYDLARKAHASALAAFRAAEEKQMTSARRVERLRDIRAELEGLTSALAEQNGRREEGDLQGKIEAAERAMQELAVLAERINALRAAEDAAKSAHGRFAGAREAHRAAQVRLQELVGAEAGLAESVASAVAQQAGIQRELEQLAEEREQLRAGQIVAERFARHQHLVSRLEGLTKRKADAEATRRAKEDLAVQLNAVKIDEGDVRTIRSLSRELAAAESRLAAGSPSLTVYYDAKATIPITLDGAQLPGDEAIRLERPVELTLPGIGRIAISPGQFAGGEDPVVLRDAAKLKLATALKKVGVASPDEAEARLLERRRLVENHERQDLLLANIAPEGVEALERQVLEVRKDVDLLAADLPSEPVVFDEATSQTVSAAVHEAEVRGRGAAKTVADVQERRARVAAEITALRERVAEHDAQLPANETDRDRHAAVLLEAVDAATRDLNAVLRERAAWQDGLPSTEDLDLMRARLKQLATATAERTRQIQKLRDEAQTLEGALGRDLEDGVDSNAAALREQLSSVEAALARVERDVAALELLDSQMSGLRQQRSEQITLPLANRIRSIAEQVLPDLMFDVDEDLGVSGVRRAELHESYDVLSDGTREQIAVLARLALSDVLKEGGAVVPLILDDALVYSDDARLRGVFGALAETARDRQIIVLSCHERSFRPLAEDFGARVLEVVPAEVSVGRPGRSAA